MNRRRTRKQEAVRAALEGGGGYLSAQALHRILEQQGIPIGLSTVYRNLAGLGEAGLADVLHSPDGTTLYHACHSPEGVHHHLVCRSCGRTAELELAEADAALRAAAAERGFVHADPAWDVFGICAACSTQAAR
ncbi:Fur family ferric uptake transcriptional regulator [Arthrobacter sp. GAS37]|uniref:Fur family transcriptional regulator n=1 Tax=Arthrobacter sp. GAS37 TaxID=3156261 RepID=UPI003833B246